MNILLVEDEPPIADVLSRNLRARGNVVRVEGTGRDSLLALTEAVPDVMVLDINLPDLTGWEVLRRLAPADRERVPVIVLSASPLAPSRVQEFQPAGVLVKPFPMDALVRLIEEVTPEPAVDRGASHA
ncbi:MAG: response regulator transcription factor [Chloroflexi bacterium]|nr:response regulator transcription factor [Chloroflexota bacterium]